MNWDKKIENVTNIIESVTKLSMHVRERLLDLQNHIGRAEIKEERDDKLLDLLYQVRSILQSLDSSAGNASNWFLVVRSNLERMKVLFEEVDRVRTETQEVNTSEEGSKSKISTLESRIKFTSQSIDAMKRELESKNKLTDSLIREIIGYITTYASLTSKIGGLKSADAGKANKSLASKDMDKDISSLRKELKSHLA